MNCLARVSRLYYPTLSLVSKRFRSLVASLDLYQTRTLLGTTESCLYLCIRFGFEHIPHWFTLSRRPTQTPKFYSRWFASWYRILTKKETKSSDNLMVSIPPLKLTSLSELTRMAISSNIYLIGIDSNGALTFRFYFMDCRSHTLHEVPGMRVARRHPLMTVLDGKLYVMESGKDPDYSMSIEFFDPKTKTWEHVPSPSAEIGGSYVSETLVYDGKLYLFGDEYMVYKAKENKWDVVGSEMPGMPMRWTPSYPCCVVDNIIYSYGRPGLIYWYDSEGIWWRLLKGLEELPCLPNDSTCVRLVDYGEKIAVLWETNEHGTESEKKMIWCAVIALERRYVQEIYGKIEWCDLVLTVPNPSSILGFVAVNV